MNLALTHSGPRNRAKAIFSRIVGGLGLTLSKVSNSIVLEMRRSVRKLIVYSSPKLATSVN